MIKKQTIKYLAFTILFYGKATQKKKYVRAFIGSHIS